MSCSECEFSDYPASYGSQRRRAAIAVLVVSLFTQIFGVLLFWLRRSEPFIAKRDWYLSVGFFFCGLLWLYAPFREYYGEGAMPCALYFLIGNISNSVLPGIITVRILALYARHVHQDAVFTLASPESTNNPKWHTRMDSVVTHYKFNSVRVQFLLILLISLPRQVYYVVRLIISPTYRSVSAVGCRYDLSEDIMYVVAPAMFFSVLIPVLFRLLKRPDSFGLRNELLFQIVVFPPFLLWFYVGKFGSSDYDSAGQNGDYAVSALLICVSLTSHWAPALLSYQTRLRDRQVADSSEACQVAGVMDTSDCQGLVDTTATVAEALSPKIDEFADPETMEDRVLTCEGHDASAASHVRQSDMALVLASIATADYVSTPVTARELLKTLKEHPQYILVDATKLFIIGALLACTELGRGTLMVLLQREFCAENVVFFAAAIEIRAKIKSLVTRAACVIPTAQADLPGTIEICNPLSNLDLGTAVELPRSACLHVSDHSEDANILTNSFTQLVLRHLCRGSVMEVNVGANMMGALTSASAAFSATSAPGTSSEVRIAAANWLAQALLAIERDLFNILIRGPVFRFVQSQQFRFWADNLVLILSHVTINNRRPSITSSPSLSPRAPV